VYGASLPPGNDGPLAGDWNQVLSPSSRRNIYHRETVVDKQMSSGSEGAPFVFAGLQFVTWQSDTVISWQPPR
jgi:hypothetical protein